MYGQFKHLIAVVIDAKINKLTVFDRKVQDDRKLFYVTLWRSVRGDEKLPRYSLCGARSATTKNNEHRRLWQNFRNDVKQLNRVRMRKHPKRR